ncbi:MAG TPA: hypothetical protein VNH80_11270, partial [Burkholderiales bacterium]|nr:hypothetical protein [Burkholderiales bacterium]
MTPAFTESRIAQNGNPKSPENPPHTRRFLRNRLLHHHRCTSRFNSFAILHGRRPYTVIPNRSFFSFNKPIER